ncbi:MAG: glycosyltransferase [Acidobacteria bacterium]|nr:glycosyltransferase [Acidobacteriota bacterium]
MSAGLTALSSLNNKHARDVPVAEMPGRISIIIPALNESATLRDCLPGRLPPEVCEVILADGGSTDATVAIARERGWKIVASPPGRATQMNAGAAFATGEILLFLHADTELPERYASEIRRVLALPKMLAGAFRLGIRSPRLSLRIIAWLANFRSATRQLPFGDQAIFISADQFRDVGGYPDLPIMEDYELMRRLRRRGRVGLARGSVLTSARRWQRLGVFQTTLINQSCQLAYRCGVSPNRIHRWYYGSRSE